jgi:cobalt-zinc-cadmium efflux system outer membrane protein
MKRFVSNLILIFLIVAGKQPTACAQTNHFDLLTLEQAWRVAEKLKPELAEAHAQIDAASGRVQQAGAFPNPTGIARTESAPFSGQTARQAEYLAGVSQPIPLGGRLNKAREVEELERQRRTKELEVRRHDLRRRVHGAFATALYQDRAFEKQTELVSTLEQAAMATKARVEVGDAGGEELARAEMEALRAKVELRRSQEMREHARMQLKAEMGDPHLAVEKLAGELEATFEIPTLETLAADLSAHPETVLVEAEIRGNQARVDLAKAARVPDIQAELLYHRLEASKQNSFDVSLSIPLPLFDRNRGRVREARGQVVAAEARARATQISLATRLHEAHAHFVMALANSQQLKNEVLPRAQSVLEVVEARYGAGDISLNEALPVRRDWAAVQLTYLESLRDVLQAWTDLKSFMKKP